MRKLRILAAALVAVGTLVSVAPAAGTASAACAKSHRLTAGQSPWVVATLVKRATGTAKTIGAISGEIQSLNRGASWRVGTNICLPSWAATAPPPTTSPAPPSGSAVPAYSPADSATIIRQEFAAFASRVTTMPASYSMLIQFVAVRIAWHESHLNNRNVNGSGCCVGLFQINYSAHRDRPWLRDGLGVKSKEAIKDPVLNTRAAIVLFKGRASRLRPGSWCAWDRVVRVRAWQDTVRAYPEIAFDPVTGNIDPVRSSRYQRHLGISCT